MTSSEVKMKFIQGFLLSLLFTYGTLAVTVIPLIPGTPKSYNNPIQPALSPYDIISRTNKSLPSRDKISFWSYYYGRGDDYRSFALKDSFVHGAIEASVHNQHLALRPEDV
jgi:hypothetical protein